MGSTNVGERLNTLLEEYNSSHAHWLNKELKLKKEFILVAWLRLTFFVGAFALPFVVFQVWSLPFFCLFFVLFFTFLVFVWQANKVSERRQYTQHRIRLLKKELRCANNNWTDEVDGEELIEPDHEYAHDLDLFGKGSLFQFINRTSTKGGYLQLAYKLKNISFSSPDIEAKQKAIAELAVMDEYRQHYYALGAQIAEGNKKNRVLDLNKLPDLTFLSKLTKVVIISFLSFLLVSIVLISFNVWSVDIVAYLFFVGLFISGSRLKNINRVHGEVASLGNYLDRYSNLIKHVEQTDYTSSYLKEVKEKLSTDGKKASVVMKQLAGHIKLFDQRLNMLLGVVLNGFFLWDLIVCVRLQQWYSKYGTQLNVWLQALHELEAMNSLATFSFNHPDAIFPKLSDDVIFKADKLGHPLIPTQERVSNSFLYSNSQRICVVTGANMAGKSTFLRTVGVALVLAGNGCAVAAKEFTYKPMLFITNMRAIDNLLKHESYFFAELSRLKMIIDRLKEAGELFFILDEILKGTNSLDKYQGSMALIKQLVDLNGCGLVATHDLELGQLAKQTSGRVFNNCFEVSFKGDGLNFDYKLREGVTQSHNATFLMMKMGLIPKENVRQ